MWPRHIDEDTRHHRILNNHRTSPEYAWFAGYPPTFEGPEPDLVPVPLYSKATFAPAGAIASTQHPYPTNWHTQSYQFTNFVVCNPQASFQNDGFPSNPLFDSVPVTNAVCGPQWDPVNTGPLPPPLPTVNQERPHPCNTCTTAFKYRKDLNRHMDTVHATGQELVYRCSCGKCDIRKDNHRRHVGTCSRKRWGCPYVCKCLSRHMDEAEYLGHVSSCLAVAPARR